MELALYIHPSVRQFIVMARFIKYDFMLDLKYGWFSVKIHLSATHFTCIFLCR
jgi:hypothetical protein